MLLSDGVSALSLPDDLDWTDEYAWADVEQSVERSITGALLVDTAVRVKGRPITLEASDTSAWVGRSAIEDQLRVWAGNPGQVLTLTLIDGRSFQVMFRHQDGPGVEARPLFHVWPVLPDDPYILILRFMEV